ncbi:MAG: glycosyltransferase family 4 protein [Cyclobacteriaceae bacterium]|nr:glycosyltransferase family 4 protein [Cyclobacteriaceae bacterium]
MNILLITQEDYLAGSTFSVSYLAKALAARGNKVYVAARENSMLHELVSDSAEVIFLPLTIRSRFDRKAIRLLRSWADNYHLDVINAQSSKDRYITIFARIFYGVKAKLFHTRRQYPMSAGGFLQRKLYVSGTDKIIMISHELKRIFIQKGFPAHHLQVIHNGIPASRYTQWSEEEVARLRGQHGIKPGDIVIGSIARLKRQEQILKALALLNRPEIKVLFVGITEGHFDSLCRELNLENQVMYSGAVKAEAVLNYYRLLTINVLASTIDGFGLVLLEAMAMGVPVVATRFGGIVDVVRHNENGLLFDDDDIETLASQLTLLVSNEPLRKQLIAQGYKTAYEEFSIEKTAANYEAFFQQQLDQA